MKRALAILVTVLLGATGASANPTIDPGIVELGALPRRILEHGDAADEERMAKLLGLYGIGWMKSESLVVVDTHFDRFQRAIVWSQRAGVGIDPAIQALLRGRLEGTLRDTVVTQLHEWMRLPPDVKTSRGRGSNDAYELLRCQMLAACELAEWRDSTGADAIRERIAAGGLDESNLFKLRAALDRFSDPCSRRLLATDGHGAMRVCADAQQVTVQIDYRYPRSPSAPLRTSHRRRLLAAEVDSLLRAFGAADERIAITSRWAVDDATLHLSAKGGSGALITWLGGERFTYTTFGPCGFIEGIGFSGESAGALLERWTSRPVRLSDDE